MVCDKVNRSERGVFMTDKIILTCTECVSRNYTSTKYNKTHTARIELKKFCNKCNKHTLHKETK